MRPPVHHTVEAGYLGKLLPNAMPKKGESWQEIFKDLDRIILPGLVHCHSPNFHSFFSSGQSFAGIVGHLLTASFVQIPSLWDTSPIGTELEVAMLNWLGKLSNLPTEFLNYSESGGGGVILKSANEGILQSILAAREKKIKEIKYLNTKLIQGQFIELRDGEIRNKLVVYASENSKPYVTNASVFASVSLRQLTTNADGSLRGSTLAEAILKDKSEGLIPCCVIATLGTETIYAFDNLVEIGPLCKKENIWLHAEADIAGSVFLLPEYRYLMKGMEYADSFSFSPSKCMPINADCSPFWFKDSSYWIDAFRVDRIYLTNNCKSSHPEFRLWQINTERRFEALKIWIVLRIHGVEGIQKYIRRHISFASYFKKLVESDSRFDVVSADLGLVCFRLKGENNLTRNLVEKLMLGKKIHVMGCQRKNRFFIRFVVNSWLSEEIDIDFAWKEIQMQTSNVSFY